MPTNQYAGVSGIFGIGVHMAGEFAPREVQENRYPGLSGVETIDLGGRGRTTKVTGVLVGADLAALIAAKHLLESYHDGIPRTFYDSAGVMWRNVRMGAPQFDPGGYRNGGTAFFWQYALVMMHNSAT